MLKKSLSIMLVIAITFSLINVVSSESEPNVTNIVEDYFNSGVAGFTGSNVSQYIDGDNRYAKIYEPIGTKIDIYKSYNVERFNINKINYPNKVTFESRFKFSTTPLNLVQIHGNENKVDGYPLAASISASGNRVAFGSASPALNLTYITDPNPAMPDFTKGWQTMWAEVDFRNNTTKVYLDGNATFTTYTNTDLGTIRWLRFGQYQSSVVENITYVDYIKVYEGSARNVPKSVGLSLNFEDGVIPTHTKNTSGNVAVVPDPQSISNKVLKLEATSNNFYVDLPLEKSVGKMSKVKFKAYITNGTAYHNFPQFFTTTWESPIVTPILNGQVYAVVGGKNVGNIANVQDGEWRTFEYFIDQENKHFKAYVDNQPDAVLRTSTDTTGNPLNVIRFAFTTIDNIYLDDIQIEELSVWDRLDEVVYTELENAINNPNIREYVIPEGTYYFNYPLILNNLRDFTLKGEDGKKVEFIINGDINGITLTNCKNVTIKNITIDYKIPSFSQGTITAIQKINSTNTNLTVLIDENDGAGFNYDVPNSTDTRWLTDTRGIYFDATTKKEIPSNYNDAIKTILPTATAREIKVGMGKISTIRPLVVGNKIVFIRRSNGMGLYQNGGENNTFEDINIYSAWGFGIFDGNGIGGNTYNRVVITTRPYSNRLLATSADGFHSYNIKNGHTITNCEFAHTADDILNVHSFYSIVTKNDNGTLAIVSPFGTDFTKSSKLTFYDFMSLNNLGSFSLETVTPVTDTEKVAAKTALDNTTVKAFFGITNGIRTIPETLYTVHTVTPSIVGAFDAIPQYTLVESSDIAHGKGTVIRNTKFHDSHVRGALIRPEGAVLENNEFYDINGPAIQVSIDRYFLEGTPGKNIVIKNNIIENTNRAIEAVKGTFGAIFVTGNPSDNTTLSNNYNIENITIVGNIIKNNGGMGVFATNLNVGRISNNTITNPFITGAITTPTKWILQTPNYGIYVANSKDVIFFGNQAKETTNSYMTGKLFCNGLSVATDGRAWAESRIVNNGIDDILMIKLLTNSDVPNYDGDIFVINNNGSITRLALPILGDELAVAESKAYQKVFVWNKTMQPYCDAVVGIK